MNLLMYTYALTLTYMHADMQKHICTITDTHKDKYWKKNIVLKSTIKTWVVKAWPYCFENLLKIQKLEWEH